MVSAATASVESRVTLQAGWKWLQLGLEARNLSRICSENKFIGRAKRYKTYLTQYQSEKYKLPTKSGHLHLHTEPRIKVREKGMLKEQTSHCWWGCMISRRDRIWLKYSCLSPLNPSPCHNKQQLSGKMLDVCPNHEAKPTP